MLKLEVECDLIILKLLLSMYDLCTLPAVYIHRKIRDFSPTVQDGYF